jgi:hypothetical protein
MPVKCGISVAELSQSVSGEPLQDKFCDRRKDLATLSEIARRIAFD